MVGAEAALIGEKNGAGGLLIVRAMAPGREGLVVRDEKVQVGGVVGVHEIAEVAGAG